MNKENVKDGDVSNNSLNNSMDIAEEPTSRLEPNLESPNEVALNSDKPYQTENTEDVIKFSHLLFEVNRLLRYTSIIKSETKFLVKIQDLLNFNDMMNAKLLESLIQGTPAFQRVRAKVSYLKNIYEYFSNHRAFLLDYTIMYLGAILHHMKILKNLDYRRVLYVKNQVSKCKLIIMNCIKEGCPNVCSKYKETKVKSILKEQNSKVLNQAEDDDDCLEKVVKKVKAN